MYLIKQTPKYTVVNSSKCLTLMQKMLWGMMWNIYSFSFLNLRYIMRIFFNQAFLSTSFDLGLGWFSDNHWSIEPVKPKMSAFTNRLGLEAQRTICIYILWIFGGAYILERFELHEIYSGKYYYYIQINQGRKQDIHE